MREPLIAFLLVYVLGAAAAIGLGAGVFGDLEPRTMLDRFSSDRPADLAGERQPGPPPSVDEPSSSENGLSTESAGGYNLNADGVLDGNAGLRTNSAGVKIIKDSEALRLEAYQGPAGNWLIGYGHSQGVSPGMVISEARAEELLRDDLRAFEDGVKRLLTVPVNENEFSAMVSLAYNLGVGGFGRTVVLERLNAGDRQGAADGFLRHNRARINGELTVLDHLTHRRELERELFLTPVG